jgi:cytochrome c biogenesis protein CcdA
MRPLAVNGFVSGFIHITLAVLWIGLFLQNKRKRTVNIIHIMLLVIALGILFNSLYEVFNKEARVVATFNNNKKT